MMMNPAIQPMFDAVPESSGPGPTPCAIGCADDGSIYLALARTRALA